jgi:phosphate starvation-inducible membrane PsiE
MFALTLRFVIWVSIFAEIRQLIISKEQTTEIRT